jgi:hypothetical protein
LVEHVFLVFNERGETLGALGGGVVSHVLNSNSNREKLLVDDLAIFLLHLELLLLPMEACKWKSGDG